MEKLREEKVTKTNVILNIAIMSLILSSNPSWAETPDAQSSPQDQQTTEKGTRQQIPEGWDWFITRGTYEANKGLDQAENVASEKAHDEIFDQLERDLLEKRFDEAMQRRRREQPPAEEESSNPPPQAEPLQPSTPRPIDGLDWITFRPKPTGIRSATLTVSGVRGQAGGSPTGPQFGPPKPGDPMPPSDSDKGPFGFGPKGPNEGGVYGPPNPDGSWPSQSNPPGAFNDLDKLNQGPKGLLQGGNTPTAAFDSGPQSRNMGSGVFTVDKPVEADGYKSGPECDH